MMASSCAATPASPPYGLPSESRGPSVPSLKPRTESLPPVKMCRCGGSAVVSPNALPQPRSVDIMIGMRSINGSGMRKNCCDRKFAMA